VFFVAKRDVGAAGSGVPSTAGFVVGVLGLMRALNAPLGTE
jgi:hypothetical protein